ncbi:MAG: hypothetical protein AAGC84_09545 [Pseudomonas sp.]
MKRIFSLALLSLGLAANAPVFAHGLYCQCQAIEGGQIRCNGGMSDGTALPGATLDVLGYDDKPLVTGKLGADSSFTFVRPAGEFYVLLELGPGHTVEIDHKQIAQ